MTPERRRFFEQMPFEFAICGWRVRFTERPNEAVGLEVLTLEDTEHSSGEVGRPKGPRFIENDHVIASRDELKPFFKAFLRSPAGIRVLTFGPHDSVNEKRIKALICSFDAWRRLNGARDKDGRLKEALRCIAYFKTDSGGWENCSSRTKNASGLCRHHNHPDVKTLWNHDPFSELDLIWDRLEQLTQGGAEDPERERERRAREREEARAQRKPRWHHVAQTIEYTATDRQIHLLLDLGADPERLRGITKSQASELIEHMLYD